MKKIENRIRDNAWKGEIPSPMEYLNEQLKTLNK